MKYDGSLVERQARVAGGWLQHNLLTTFTTVIGLAVLIVVPQIHNVFFDLPAAVKGADWIYIGLWFGYLVVAWSLGMTLLRLIDPVRGDSESASGKAHRRFVVAGCLVAFAAFLFAFPPDELQIRGLHGHAFLESARLYLPTLLIATAAWIAPLRRYLPKWGLRERAAPVEVLIRFTLVILALYAFGELIWLMAGKLSHVSYRAYTIWGVLQILFLLIAAGRLLDVLFVHGWSLVRPTAILALASVPFLWGPSLVGRPVQTSPLAVPNPATSPEREDELASVWFDAFTEKLDSVPEGPVLFVAASGGGSRAALFTSLVLNSLEEIEFQGATLADRVVLISSVSGGSLASAYFAVRPEGDATAPWEHSVRSDIASRVRLESSKLLEVERGRSPAPNEPIHQKIIEALTALSVADDLEPKIGENRYIDHMNMDFMAPILRGFLHPLRGRGESLSSLWEETFGWSEIDNRKPLPQRDGRKPPLLLLNATQVEQGNRFVIGIPGLPPRLLDGLESGSHSLSSRGDYSVSLAEAVRVSANFPWGIPVAQLGLNPPTHLLDGGILDNTGLDTLSDLITGLRNQIVRSPGEPLGEQSAALLARLQERGMLVLEIDSGAKPAALGKTADTLPEILNPLRALERSNHLRLEGSRQSHLALLREIGRAPAPYRCDEASVMTAWALGPADKARVIVRFLLQQAMRQPLLLKQLEFSHVEPVRTAGLTLRSDLIQNLGRRVVIPIVGTSRASPMLPKLLVLGDFPQAAEIEVEAPAESITLLQQSQALDRSLKSLFEAQSRPPTQAQAP